MKVCSTCKETKPLTAYYKQSRAPDGLQRQCKVCANKASAAAEKRNADKYYDIRKRAKDKFRSEIREYKAARGCAHCGEADPICLELHHPDPSVKDLHPSDAGGRKMFYEEADKCIVLCANCHRKEHERLRDIGK